VLAAFEPLTLTEFSLVPDSSANGGLLENAAESLADQQEYGCGCYRFVKEA
jgi:hypothetical protein